MMPIAQSSLNVSTVILCLYYHSNICFTEKSESLSHLPDIEEIISAFQPLLGLSKVIFLDASELKTNQGDIIWCMSLRFTMRQPISQRLSKDDHSLQVYSSIARFLE